MFLGFHGVLRRLGWVVLLMVQMTKERETYFSKRPPPLIPFPLSLSILFQQKAFICPFARISFLVGVPFPAAPVCALNQIGMHGNPWCHTEVGETYKRRANDYYQENDDDGV